MPFIDYLFIGILNGLFVIRVDLADIDGEDEALNCLVLWSIAWPFMLVVLLARYLYQVLHHRSV